MSLRASGPRDILIALVMAMALCPAARATAAPAMPLAAPSDPFASDPPPGEDAARAGELFKEGVAELDAGKADSACPKLAESLRLDRAPGTLLNLARCHQQQGKLASAWREYREVSDWAAAKGMTDRAKAAADLAAALEPKLSKLRIQVLAAAPELAVKLDGTRVEERDLGVFVAIDPGVHAIVAEAEGRAPWSTKVEVGRDADQQTVAIPELDPVKPAPTPAAPSADGGGPSAVQLAGYVVGGIGVVGLAVGAALGIVTLNDLSEAEEDPTLCPSKTCTPAGREAVDSATTEAHISTVGLVVGGAALIAGVVMVLVGGDDDVSTTSETSVAVELDGWVAPTTAGVSLKRRF